MFKTRIEVKGLDLAIARNARMRQAVLPATISALNATGDQILKALKDQMIKDFDRPTPYTLNSLTRTKAKAGKLYVTILPKDWAAGKGTEADKYLKPEIYGGDRNVKRFELALRRKRILPFDMYAVPGSGATLDAYGNMSRGQIVQILSFFGGAEKSAGYTANMTEKGKARLAKGSRKRGRGFEYFVARPGNKHNLHPGIYQRFIFAWGKANEVKAVLIFVKKPVYRKRYRWGELASETAMTNWAGNFRAAMGVTR